MTFTVSSLVNYSISGIYSTSNKSLIFSAFIQHYRSFAVNFTTLQIEFVKKFEWQKKIEADKLYFILRGSYKKFSKHYPKVFQKMADKVAFFKLKIAGFPDNV